jgi:hypothetical protein
MIIYPEPGTATLRAVYFDNEGHVINYAVSFPGEKAAVFLSESGTRAPGFRMEYALKPDGTLSNVFSIAPPGGGFKVYAQGTLKKKL